MREGGIRRQGGETRCIVRHYIDHAGEVKMFASVSVIPLMKSLESKQVGHRAGGRYRPLSLPGKCRSVVSARCNRAFANIKGVCHNTSFWMIVAMSSRSLFVIVPLGLSKVISSDMMSAGNFDCQRMGVPCSSGEGCKPLQSSPSQRILVWTCAWGKATPPMP